MIYKMAQTEDFQIQTKSGGIVTVPDSSVNDTLVTREQAEEGWWSKWEIETLDPSQTLRMRLTDEGWIVEMPDGDGGWLSVVSVAKGNDDSEELSWSFVKGEAAFDISAIRHLVCAPVPTKPEDIYAMPAGIVDKGDAVGSVVQVQTGRRSVGSGSAVNRAVSKAAVALGEGTFAGQKGYRYIDRGAVSNSLTFETPPTGWYAGDIVSVVCETKYADCVTITEINGATVTFDKNLPFNNVPAGLTDFDDYVAYVSTSPNVGNVDLGIGAVAEGSGSRALNADAHAEGRDTKALGEYSHAEGRETTAQYVAHAEGSHTNALGNQSHAEGYDTTASGADSHAEGVETTASGYVAHAEGYNTSAKGSCAHTEGTGTKATGPTSHAEGETTEAIGYASHAEGLSTITGGRAAHAEGISAIAGHNYSFAWNGVSTEQYMSKGTGTFNINPMPLSANDPTTGFFIGNRSLKDIVGSGGGISDHYNSIFLRCGNDYYEVILENDDGVIKLAVDQTPESSRRATTFSFTDSPDETYTIEGELGRSKMIELGYLDANGNQWIKQPTSVAVGSSVTSVGPHTFEDCGNLKSITIPNSVTSIGDYALASCNGLTEIAIPNSVTTIGEEVFYECTNLTSVTIPNSVTNIGSGVFYNCTHLSSVTISDSITSITYGMFYGCGSLKSITIPNSVTTIEAEAFYGCSGLTSVTIGNGVTSIGANVFELCGALTSLTIGNSVTTIGDYAFDSCGSLTSLTIPASVTDIGYGVFNSCQNLMNVTFEGKTKTQVTGNIQYAWNLESGCTISSTADEESWTI